MNHCFPRWVLKVRLQLLVSPSPMHPNLEESVFLLCIWICIFVTLPGFTISFTFLAGVCPGSNSWRHDPCVWTCALAGGRWIYPGYIFVFGFYVFQRPILLIDLTPVVRLQLSYISSDFIFFQRPIPLFALISPQLSTCRAKWDWKLGPRLGWKLQEGPVRVTLIFSSFSCCPFWM